MMTVLLLFVVGYLLGSIPTGLLLSRLAGLGDIRNIGSGNIGATNVLRSGRKDIAALTLVIDLIKGLAAVLLFSTVGGIGAVVGHCFPIWLRFKGGKGVATGLGVALGLSWKLGLILAAIWLVAVALSRRSSVGALSAVGLAVPVGYALSLPIWPLLILAALIIAKHHANIVRLMRGEEPKIGDKS